MKQCKHCNKWFNENHHNERYCSNKCRKIVKNIKDKKYKNNNYEKVSNEIRRLKLERKVLNKNATNSGNKFTIKEVNMILEKENDKWKYTAKFLAYELKRSKQSIEQIRYRAKIKKK